MTEWGAATARAFASGVAAGLPEADRTLAKLRASPEFRTLPADLQRRVGLVHWRVRQALERQP